MQNNALIYGEQPENPHYLRCSQCGSLATELSGAAPTRHQIGEITMRHPIERTVSRQWWVINVSGYGEFAHYGTEAEAEEMRAHKASWERGIGRKRPADQDDQIVQKHMEWVRYEVSHGYPRSSEREEAETAVVLTANT